MPSYKRGGPLFDSPAWRDWAFWLGLILGGLTTFGSLGSSFDQIQPNLGFFTTGALFALFIDASLQLAIAFLLFGVIPASIRKLWRRNQVTLLPDVTRQSEKNISLLLLPIVALVMSIIAADVNARLSFADTSKAKELKTARIAVERLSSEQREAFTSLKQLAGAWNDLSIQWVKLYNDSNIGLSQFGIQAQPVVDEMTRLIEAAAESHEILIESDAESLFGEIVNYYSAKLEVLRGLTSAIATGNAMSEQQYGEQLADLNAKAEEVACESLRNMLGSPFAGGISEEEYQRGLDQLAKC